MATTALKITKNGQEQRLLFMTVPRGDGRGLDVDVFKATAEFMPEGTPSLGVSEMVDEEAYHKALRDNAFKEGHFVPEFSTNPEWNPGYVEEVPVKEEYPDFHTDAGV